MRHALLRNMNNSRLNNLNRKRLNRFSLYIIPPELGRTGNDKACFATALKAELCRVFDELINRRVR